MLQRRGTFVTQILKINSSYSPPPLEGFISPMTSGVEANVIERFSAAGVADQDISRVGDTYICNFPNPRLSSLMHCARGVNGADQDRL